MDYYDRSREVEKVKPFAERAQRSIDELVGLRQAIAALQGPDNPAGVIIAKAGRLLEEAMRRGVKGKDQP